MTPQLHDRIAFKTRILSFAADTTMCGLMNLVQHRRRREVSSLQDIEHYTGLSGPLSREEYFACDAPDRILRKDTSLSWPSPRGSSHTENHTVHAHRFFCAQGKSAPTVLILHALMSASDIGYRKVAARFNAFGWNAVFPHLPFHYSRVPKGFLNGELAITANLVRNAETLRSAVVEIRQLLMILRAEGATRFGVLGTSYGGWAGALLSFLEPDLQFLALIQPIVNVESAIWENPGAWTMRRQLSAKNVRPGASDGIAHLISPLHGRPLCGGGRTILTSATLDRVSPPKYLDALAEAWGVRRRLAARHGHFGYQAMSMTLAAIEAFHFGEAF